MRPTVFPWAEFTADLPDDMIEANGVIVRYGGKNVAAAIAEMLRQLGATVTEPEHRAEHGWDFFADFCGRTVWCQVTQIETYVFVMQETKSVLSFREPLHPRYLELLSKLADALEADPRFNEVRWLAHLPPPAAQPRLRPVSYG